MFNTELIADVFLAFGFAAVSQDMRGTCLSEGKFSLWHLDEADGVDTVAWILKQPWSDGRVLVAGASADGIASLQLARAGLPSIKAQFVMVASALARRAIFPGGAFREGLTDGWLKATVPSESSALIREVREHEGASAWWDAVEIKGSQWKSIRWPSVHWSGWYDIFLHGHLYTYHGFQHKSALPGAHYIVVDPLGHCQDAAQYFPHNLVEGRALLPVLLTVHTFKRATNRSAEGGKVPEGVGKVTFYVMGSTDAHEGHGNYWTSLADWPTAESTPLYLASGGRLAWSQPSEPLSHPPTNHTPSAATSTSWVYDPKSPAPTIGGSNLILRCGPLDQRPVEARPDVAVFTSAVLDEPLAITGALEAYLHVSSANVNDTDFHLRLTDVYPDGTSRLIQDGIQRMRWRAGVDASSPTLMQPGEVYQISICLWNTSYVFSPGHRIRLVVGSANAPRFQPNPNTGRLLAHDDDRSVIAHNSVHHSATQLSAIYLPIVKLSQLPRKRIIEDIMSQVNGSQAQLHNALNGGAFTEALKRLLKLPTSS